jgi:ACR3 family arsenite efflux pump ArsB
LEFGNNSQINIPIAVLIWLMIIPMMMKVDFAAIRDVGKRPRGLFVTLFINWLVKPFSMALFAWLFFRFVFSAWIPPADADQYIAGTIILAAFTPHYRWTFKHLSASRFTRSIELPASVPPLWWWWVPSEPRW